MERIRMVGEGMGFAGLLAVLMMWGELAQAIVS